MKKKLKITLNAPFTLGFALLCGLATLLCAVSGECTVLLFSTHASSMSDPLMYLRLFTHVLGHSGLAHLIGNMTLILLLGPALEEKYGAFKLLLVILATALVTGIIHNLFFPSTMLLGASGVVFAMILLTSFTGFREGEIPLPYYRRSCRFRRRMASEPETEKKFLTEKAPIIMIGALCRASCISRSSH